MAQVSSLQDGSVVPAGIDALVSGPRRGAILVVEDRADVRQGLAQLLELNGFLVFDAADGQQAMAHLQADPESIALILLDLMLPGQTSGRDVRAQQLGDTRLAHIPAIILSACEPDMRGRAQLRPEAWLEKPFRFDALLEIIRRYVVPERSGLVGSSD
jgi:CheY-like chemotaxis protein